MGLHGPRANPLPATLRRRALTAAKPPRKPRLRTGKVRFPPATIAAWQACDWAALHCALGLAPYEASPLPVEITPLGVSEHRAPDPGSNRLGDASYAKALALQRALIACAGWPDCRGVYEKNLADAKEMRDYYQELVDYPGRGPYGERLDKRRADLKEAKAEVAYRRRLLAELPR